MNIPTAAPRRSAPRAPTPPLTRHGELTPRSVWWFFAATFAVTWGLGMATMVFIDQIEAVFGPMSYTNPVFILMVYSPGFVALFMVWRHHGIQGLLAFLRRFTLWRMSAWWWALLLLGMPAVFYVGAAVNGNATDFPFDPWYGVLPALLPALFIGPIEELGWRGVALPLLQRRFAPLWSALIVGVIAAVWHTPAFLMSGTKQSNWNFWPFFFGVVAISVILTPMFNAARGSLLIAALFHAQMNGPAWPDAQPWDMLGFVLLAIGVVVVNRRSILDRDSGATEVLAPSSRGHASPGAESLSPGHEHEIGGLPGA